MCSRISVSFKGIILFYLFTGKDFCIKKRENLQWDRRENWKIQKPEKKRTKNYEHSSPAACQKPQHPRKYY